MRDVGPILPVNLYIIKMKTCVILEFHNRKESSQSTGPSLKYGYDKVNKRTAKEIEKGIPLNDVTMIAEKNVVMTILNLKFINIP